MHTQIVLLKITLFLFLGYAWGFVAVRVLLYCRDQGLLSSRSVSHCDGISCCRERALGCEGFSSCSSWALEHRLSSYGAHA